jgi:hypothetical protein
MGRPNANGDALAPLLRDALLPLRSRCGRFSLCFFICEGQGGARGGDCEELLVGQVARKTKTTLHSHKKNTQKAGSSARPARAPRSGAA